MPFYLSKNGDAEPIIRYSLALDDNEFERLCDGGEVTVIDADGNAVDDPKIIAQVADLFQHYLEGGISPPQNTGPD